MTSDTAEEPTAQQRKWNLREWLKKLLGKDDETLEEWFQKECDKHTADWKAAVDLAMAERKASGVAEPQRIDVEAFLAENALIDLQRMDGEISLLLTCLGYVLTAVTLLFAVFALRPPDAQTAHTFNVALWLTGVSFFTTLVALRRPVRRAWFQRYEKRHKWTLLVTSHYKRWVLYGWLGDRRTPVATTYKKSQAVAVPVLLAAAVVAVIALTRSVLY